jgi:hypothetical protein
VSFSQSSPKPEDLLHFVYLDGFCEDWEGLGLSVETELWVLETTIMLNPERGAVIPGTGGLRKLRFGAHGKGKRGGLRIIYLLVPEHFTVVMAAVYAKNEQDNLSGDEKSILRSLVDEVLKLFEDKG